jgi:tetratricopeptide (TPR) repeat protein
MRPARGCPAGLVAGMLLVIMGAGPAPALPRQDDRDPSPLREKGAEVRFAMLVDYYKRLPERQEGESPESWAVRVQEGLASFRQEVRARYSEGTLHRLLAEPANDARRAAVMALGLTGTMDSNKALADRLHDGDAQVRRLAADALWAVWFRADSEANARELQKVMRMRDAQQALTAYEALLKKAPSFAEAYNQRAILYFRLEQYDKSIADCETVLKLNPCHFGAQSGLGQGYLKLRKPKLALPALQEALRINPNLQGVEETIRALEEVLGEEGKPEDK